MKKLKLLVIVATLICAITALCVCANAATYSGTCGGEGDGSNLTWTLDTSTGVLEIDGTGTMKNYSFDSAPWYSYRSSIKKVTLADGVTSIGSWAFYSCDSLASVDMPNVTSIGDYAFYGCSALTSVEIPACTTSIGSGAFRYCTSLESITVDDANTYYSSDNFGVLFNKDKSTLIQYPIGNSRTSYSVPSTVTSIGQDAFYSCSALTSVDMPNVTSIGEYAFPYCSALTSVDMPNVTSIGSHAFYYCSALTSVDMPNVTSIGEFAFASCSAITSVDIPASVTSIGNRAFSYCSSLVSVDMPNVTSIGDDAFYYCSALTSVDMPNVTSIGEGAFLFCSALTSVDMPSVSSIGEFAFRDCSALTSVDMPNVTSIGNYAFYNCSALTSVDMPNVTSIGEWAFLYCSALTSVDMPNVTSIGMDAFLCCSALTSVYMPNVTSIGERAFNFCGSLTSVYMPNVTSIGEGAFEDCDVLTSVEIPACTTSIGSYAFLRCTSLESITVDDANTYYSSDNFGVLFNKNKTTLIQYPVGNSRTSYSVPSTVTSISNYAFRDCDALTSVEMPNVTSIGNYAFPYCSALTSVDMPNVTSIGDYAFYYCGYLKKATIYSKTATFGTGVFDYTHADFAIHGYTGSTAETYANKNGHTFVAMKPVNVSGYCGGEGNGTNLEWNLNTETGVLNITGNGAMMDCYRVGEYDTPGDVFDIMSLYSYYAPWYDYAEDIKTVTISSGVTSIGECMFEDCINVVTITIPNSVKSIEYDAFYNCNGISDVYFIGSKSDWNSINIRGGNIDLINANIHYNYRAPGKTDVVTDEEKNQISFTVYENEKDSSATKDSYKISSNASVTDGISSTVTDKTGKAVIESSGNNITISKENYVSRTLSNERAKLATQINLQKNVGTRPIINAVWIENIDVYSTDYAIGLTSKDKVFIEAEIVWKSGSQSKVYLMQDARKVYFDGSTLSTVLSDNFDVSKTIYIVAEDTKGNATKKALKFKADGGIPDSINEMGLSLGSSVSGEISDVLPGLDGLKLGVDFPFIPLTVTVEDNKIYGVIGLDVAKASKEYSYIENINGKSQVKLEKTTKFLFENIKDGFKKYKDSTDISKITKGFLKARNNYTAKLGFEADLTVLGYVEAYIDTNGEVQILNGGVIVNPSYAVKLGSQIWGPLFWEGEIKGELEAMFNIYLNETASNFTPNGSLGGKISAKAGVGLGLSKTIGISGGLKGNIGINWDIYRNREDYIAVSGAIGAYAKAFIGPVILYEDEWDFAEGIIWDHPSTRVNSLALANEFDLFSLNRYSIIDRHYVQTPSEFVANEETVDVLAFEAQNKIEKEFKTNVYTYSEPQIAEFEDGSMLAVWIDDDITRNDINRTALYYSYYNGSEWSEPEKFDDDGTGDFYPNLKVIGDTAYVVFVDSNTELDVSAEPSEIFTSWEIKVAEINSNGTVSSIKRITNNTFIDTMPKVFGEEENVYVMWVENASDDIFSEGDTYSVYAYSLFDDEITPVAVDLMPVDSVDGYIYDGTPVFAFCVDTDGNQNDYTDKEIYIGNECITNNDVLDSKPTFADGKLYYYSDGSIVELDLDSKEETVIVDSIVTDRFTVITDGENKAIVYGVTKALVTELYAIFYDSESGKWGESIQITALESEISSFTGIFSTDGKLKFAINKIEIVGEIGSGNHYGQSDIVVFTVTPTYDLSIGEVIYHEELLVPGNTVEFYTDITNRGELTITEFTVEVRDEDGSVLDSTTCSEPILPGETVDFTGYYKLSDEEFVPHNVVLVVNPCDETDFNDSDNSFEVYLNCEKITLENMNYGINEDGDAIIYADIVNRGYSAQSNITATLYKGGIDGEEIDSIVVNDTLEMYDLFAATFTVPLEDDAVYYIVLDSEGEDSDFVVLDAKTFTPGDPDENGQITIRDAALILQYIAGWNVEINTDAADVDGNGGITIRDAALILQYIAGWSVELG